MNAHHRRFDDVNVEYEDVPIGEQHLHNYTRKHYTEDAMTLAEGSIIGVYEDWLRTLSPAELEAEHDKVFKRVQEEAAQENTKAYEAWSLLLNKVYEVQNRK